MASTDMQMITQRSWVAQHVPNSNWYPVIGWALTEGYPRPIVYRDLTVLIASAGGKVERVGSARWELVMSLANEGGAPEIPVSLEISKPLGHLQRRIIEALNYRSPMDNTELANVTGSNRGTVLRATRKLVELGKIESTEEGWVNAPGVRPLGSLQYLVLEALRQGPISNPALVRQLGKGSGAVSNATRRLVELGKVVQTTEGWILA